MFWPCRPLSTTYKAVYTVDEGLFGVLYDSHFISSMCVDTYASPFCTLGPRGSLEGESTVFFVGNRDAVCIKIPICSKFVMPAVSSCLRERPH